MNPAIKNPDLGIIDIELTCNGKTVLMEPNGLIIRAFDDTLPRPTTGEFLSELSDEPAIRYRTDQITLLLSHDELKRMARLILTPEEFHTLKNAHGVFFEIHDDFYDQETGEAVQPR